VDFVKSNPSYNEDRIKAFQCNVTSDDCFKDTLLKDDQQVDIVSMIFILSALKPTDFETAIQNVAKTLKSGGLLIFRDYGLNDMAMFRFKPGTKIADRHYVRQDGTTTFFFTLEQIASLMERNGFTIVVNEFVERRTINKKEELDVARIFVQGKYKKL
jgi:methyltransferase-like protein 6